MKFFGKIFKNKSVVTIVSLAVCLIIIFFAYRYRVNTAINAINVPIAAKKLEAREEITKDSFRTIKIAQSMITDNVITNQDYLIGKYVNYNTFIPEGSLFYDTSVVEWTQMPDLAWSDIQDGYTIVSLSVSVQSTYGNSVFPGDKIDLYYQNYMDGKIFIGPLIEGIEVLAVKAENGQHIFKKSAEQTGASALIFAVPDEMFSIFKRAAYISGGEIIPIPRNSSYNADTTLAKNQIIEFINTNSIEIQPDTAPKQIIDSDDTKVVE